MYTLKRKSNELLASEIVKACSFFQRLKGLLGTPVLSDNQGLWIEPCNSIHTVFMQYPIDVVFLDKHNKVTAVHHRIPTNRFRLSPLGTLYTLELASGFARKANIRVGDNLYLETI